MTVQYRHRITGVHKDEPLKKRTVAYDPWPRYTLSEHGARDAIVNMKTTPAWSNYWTDLRIERRPVETEWEPLPDKPPWCRRIPVESQLP